MTPPHVSAEERLAHIERLPSRNLHPAIGYDELCGSRFNVMTTRPGMLTTMGAAYGSAWREPERGL